MRVTFGSKFRFEPGSILETIVDVFTGSLTGTIRAIQIVSTWIYANTIRPFANNVLGLHLSAGMRPKVTNGTIKVAAVGFGRTGTYSLTLALEELGFPTLHTIHMYEYENEEILHMWDEKIVSPAFGKLEPVVGTADLQLIANSGYQAVADLPCCLFYEQIYAEYPDCKFILTTRENSEIWYRSWQSLTKSITNGMHVAGIVFPTIRMYSRYLRWVYAVVNKDVSYMTATIPSDENIKENAIASYEEHNRRVREIIPPEQLLEFNVKAGWGPLCEFLEIKDCPSTPFPKTNSASQMRAQSTVAFWVGGLILFYMINKIRKIIINSRKEKVA